MHPAACPTCCMRRVSFFCPVAPPQFTPPQPAPHLAPIIASVPVGRQCHHSAASSSARLNTGPKVQTAARAGRCALTDTCKNTHAKRKKERGKKTDYITHTHLLPFAQNLCFTRLLLHIHRQISCGKAVAAGQRSHLHGAKLVPWWWLVRQANTNFINPEVNTLWTCVFSSAFYWPINPTSFISQFYIRIC